MEDDRAQVDLGIAADIEANHIAENPVRQPKKRFIGRRAAAEATAKSSTSGATTQQSRAIQGIYSLTLPQL
jgi:2-(3-amino-3-carboxypropyl)histidine synthase